MTSIHDERDPPAQRLEWMKNEFLVAQRRRREWADGAASRHDDTDGGPLLAGRGVSDLRIAPTDAARVPVPAAYTPVYTYLDRPYAATVVPTSKQIEALLGFAPPLPAFADAEWWAGACGLDGRHSAAGTAARRDAAPQLSARIPLSAFRNPRTLYGTNGGRMRYAPSALTRRMRIRLVAPRIGELETSWDPMSGRHVEPLPRR
jgi:hypothetical protein